MMKTIVLSFCLSMSTIAFLEIKATITGDNHGTQSLTPMFVSHKHPVR
jgi:hypothetical protein